MQRRNVARVLAGLHDPRFPRRIPHQHLTLTAEHMLQRVLKVSRHEDNLHRINGPTFRLLSRQQLGRGKHRERQQHLWFVPAEHSGTGEELRLERNQEHAQLVQRLLAVYAQVLSDKAQVCE